MTQKSEKLRELKEWIKKFIREGNKIFYCEDYGNDKISSEMLNYANKKWDKLKSKIKEINK